MSAEPVAVMTRQELVDVVAGAVAKAIGHRGDDVLDRKGLAERLRVSEETVRVWERRGLPVVVLPGIRAGGRGIKRYRRRDVDRWLAAHIKKR